MLETHEESMNLQDDLRAYRAYLESQLALAEWRKTTTL